MSAGVCRLWDPFVGALERQAGLQPTGSRDPTERAARAVWALRVGQGEDLAAVVKTALPSRPGRRALLRRPKPWRD
jgi:hypothetical protein